MSARTLQGRVSLAGIGVPEGSFMTGFTAKLIDRITSVVALCVLLVGASFVNASWLGYKNDSPSPIVVQTSIVVNGKIQGGKSHTLYPGETAWDNIPTAGQRQITVMDPKANNKVIGQETINIANQDVLLSAQLQAQPQQQGKAPLPPVLRLIPIKIVGVPGVIAPKTEAPKEAPKGGQKAPVPPRSTLPPTAVPPADQPKAPAEKPKSLPPTEQPKSPPPAEKPKSPPAEQPKTPPADPPKSKPGNDK